MNVDTLSIVAEMWCVVPIISVKIPEAKLSGTSWLDVKFEMKGFFPYSSDWFRKNLIAILKRH